MKEQSKHPALQSRNQLDPFDLLHNRIDRLFRDFPWRGELPDMFAGNGRFDVVPSMEVHQNEDHVTVTAELPGVDEKDIDISVSEQMLTLSGEKKSETKTEERDYFHSERSYGRFSRTITLPFAIDADKVDAKFDKGVLTLTIPKPAEAAEKVRKIAIKH